MAIELKPGVFDALIFDCDGTLIDSASLYLSSLQTVFASHGLSFERQWYLQRTGLSPERLLNAFGVEIHPLPASIPQILRDVTTAFQSSLHTLTEIAVVAEVARRWHGEVPMAVASNGERANVEGSLRAAKLLAFFDTVVTIDDVTRGKPAPDIYLEAARRLRVAPGRCFVLEDSDEGLQAATDAGMAVLDVRPHIHGSHHTLEPL